MHRVSVIILTHNKRLYTWACLEGLLLTEGVALEAIVVDNGSTDGTFDLLSEMKRRFADAGRVLRWVANQENVGCSVGRNQGLDMAYGDYCVFMDNDVVAADRAWAPKLIRALEDEGAMLVGPKLVYPSEPHLIQCAGVGISRSGRVQFRGRGEPRDGPEFGRRRECQALISACLMFPYRLYEEIGGLDEAFGPIEFEDLDFCYRARAHGHKALYEPSAEMYHYESITSEGTDKLPNTYYIIKHGMLFKERWRHMFEQEDGPTDDECRWRTISAPRQEPPARPGS
jgi:GT2 family glycosyltransferase